MARSVWWMVPLLVGVGCGGGGTTNTADTGVPDDTGAVTDTGSVNDTGTVTDNGSVTDTGTVTDTGSVPDGGPVGDTGCAGGQTACGSSCVDTAADTNNCGSCGNVCPTGQTCAASACTTGTTCGTGQTACGSACVNLQTDGTNCGACGHACTSGQTCTAGSCTAGTVCGTGQTACGGSCVNTQTDTANCGACGHACAATEACTAGACVAMTCPTGQSFCGGTCINTATDAANCGTCGHACATGQTCAAGACMAAITCPTGQTLCSSSCVNTATDNANCGSCAHACATGQLCMASACVTPLTCATGQTACGTGSSAMCFNLQTDTANCGACGTACAAGLVCTAGACACPTGTTACGSGMSTACVNVQTSATNCGSCGHACPTGQVCTAGACACTTGQTLCGMSATTPGTCVTTATDTANCGACGHACAAGQSCTAGACVCPTGQTLCGMTATDPGTCVNTQTSGANCGACGTVCQGGRVCTAGACACPTGTTLCGTGATAVCSNNANDANNCGVCGRICGTGQICSGSACVGGTPPANDARAGAVVLDVSTPSTTATVNTMTARNDTAGPSTLCSCMVGKDVFYRFTLTQTEIVYADTVGAGWDTALFLQNAAGANLTDAGIPGGQVCNDDNGLAGCATGLQSQIAARLVAGTYYLVLGGCDSGQVTLHFQHLPVGNGPLNRITPSTTAQTVMGTTAGTGAITSACCSGGPDNTYWWFTCPSFVATPFSATSCGGATWDTELDQRSATRPSATVCNDDLLANSCFRQSEMNSTIPAGAGLHTLNVDGCGGSAGAYAVTFTLGACPAGQSACGRCVNETNDNANCGACANTCAAGQFCDNSACATPPANDTRMGATAINWTLSSQLLAADTTHARNDTAGSCGCTTGRDVYYSFTVPMGRSEVVYADTIGSTWDTSLFLQTQAGVNITVPGIAGGSTCNDDGGLTGCSTGVQSQIMAQLTPGTYYLVLSGCSQGAATVRFQHLPVGNGSVAALAVGAGQVLNGSTSGTGVINPAGSCTAPGPENTYVWYTCQAAVGGAFNASTCGRATWDTVLDQRSAGRTTPSVSVCNDDVGTTACRLQSTVASTIPDGPGLHALYVDGFTNMSFGAYAVLVTRP